MTKLNKQQVSTALDETDIWLAEYNHETDQYWSEYWDDVHSGNMSWQWYMERDIRVREGWKYVIINPIYKVETVRNWLQDNYPHCECKSEKSHMLIQDEQAATMVSLKFS